MKTLNTFITLCCLGGLVSCHPVASNPSAVSQKKVETTKKAASTEAKKQATSKTSAAKKKVTKKTTTVKKKTTPKSTTVKKTTTTTTPKKEVVKKPPVKKVTTVKNASKVPGKPGFVFNPYTHNQVDVRGIPGGTKVRDPHDSNSAHVFRVP